MFLLTRATPGSETRSAPAFKLAVGGSHGFLLSVALRSITQEVSQYPLGTPVQAGAFYWLPLSLGVGDETAIQGYQEIEGLTNLAAQTYWELEGRDETGLAVFDILSPSTLWVAHQTELAIGVPVNWVYRFDLSAYPGVAVVDVSCQGQTFTEAANPANPAPGEWVLEGSTLAVTTSALNQLSGSIQLIVTAHYPVEPESYWVGFECDWADDVVVEQIVFLKRPYVAAVDDQHPLPGEFIVTGNRVTLFTEKALFPTNVLVNREPASFAQFLGEVAL